MERGLSVGAKSLNALNILTYVDSNLLGRRMYKAGKIRLKREMWIVYNYKYTMKSIKILITKYEFSMQYVFINLPDQKIWESL